MFSSLRQLKYPKEFRIAAPKWPKELLQNTDQIVDLLLSPQEKDQEMQDLVREMGTGLWRIRNRLLCEFDPSLEIRGAMRFLESTWDALNEAGVEICDHTGEIYTGGESLRIISYEDSDEITRKQIIETIKPTIYYQGGIIQIGEVIVGIPTGNQKKETHSDPLLNSSILDQFSSST